MLRCSPSIFVVDHFVDICSRSSAELNLRKPQTKPAASSPSRLFPCPQLDNVHSQLIQSCCALQALVDRPDEIRRTESFKRLTLTDFKLDIPRLAKKSVLKKALQENDVFAKFAASAWGQKLAKRDAKASMTDFDRYKAAVEKMKRSAKVRRTLNKLKKAAK
jgi:large subunit ribosomal protein L14e